MAKTMTYREFYTTIIDCGNMPEEIIEFAKNAITKLDNKNAARKGADSKTAKAMAELREKVKEILASGAKPAKVIAKLLTDMGYGDEDGVSIQKVGAIVRSFAEGEIVTTKGKDAKGNRVNFYQLAPITIGEDAEDEDEDADEDAGEN